MTLQLAPWVVAEGARVAPPESGDGALLPLALPVAHPWLPERRLAAVGVTPELPEYANLERANVRLTRLRADSTCSRLIVMPTTDAR